MPRSGPERGNGDAPTAESRTHEYNPGEVWEENELWIDLSWRIDPDGSMGIRQWFESAEKNPGRPVGIDEYYEMPCFADSVPGLGRRRCGRRGRAPSNTCENRSAFELDSGPLSAPYERRGRRRPRSPGCERRRPTACIWRPGTAGARGTAIPPRASPTCALVSVRRRVTGGRDRRRAQGWLSDTPSKKLELYSAPPSPTGAGARVRDAPRWIPSHVHHWEDMDIAGQ